jgi:OsmC-like protein
MHDEKRRASDGGHVMSAASCFALTLAAVAERHDAPLLDATVTATGHMSRRDDGRFGFTVIEVDASLETTAEGEEAVRCAAAEAESRCLPSTSGRLDSLRSFPRRGSGGARMSVPRAARHSGQDDRDGEAT